MTSSSRPLQDAPPPPTPDDPDDARALAAHAERLASAVEAALPGWVVRSVLDRHAATGRPAPPEVEAAARRAGEDAAREVGAEVRSLLGRDVDDHPTGPLALLRTAVRHPTEVLADAGIPPVVRDEVSVRLHPDDVYDLAPAAFADVDPALHDPGITWGAAKAHVVLARRRREGLR